VIRVAALLLKDLCTDEGYVPRAHGSGERVRAPEKQGILSTTTPLLPHPDVYGGWAGSPGRPGRGRQGKCGHGPHEVVQIH